jgi:hypothetical protein
MNVVKKKTRTTVRLTVVGMQHRVTLSLRMMLQGYVENAPLVCYLKREPDNPKDENAIRVMAWGDPYRHLHVGYLSRHVAEIWAPLMDAGKLIVKYACLVEVDPREGDGEISIVVSATKDAKEWIRQQPH